VPKAKPKPPSDFNDLLTRLARVPKKEIDAQEKKYERRKNDEPAKPGRIVPARPSTGD
jgi:hypothetical protein